MNNREFQEADILRRAVLLVELSDEDAAEFALSYVADCGRPLEPIQMSAILSWSQIAVNLAVRLLSVKGELAAVNAARAAEAQERAGSKA
jgi:hypothetical protein